MSNEQYCILVRNCSGKKKEKGLIKSTTSRVDVLPGTLLVLVFRDIDKRSHHQNNQYELETVDQENVEVRCSDEDFKRISIDDFNLLMSIPTCNERMTIFHHESWLREGVELSCGDYVDVYDKQLARDLTGVLRFKGLVEGVKGTHFGVELIVSTLYCEHFTKIQIYMYMYFF